jgi:putative ABC transport system permease protein
MAAPELAASRLLPRDVLRVGGIGLRTRRLRASLSALGIAIGIGSMVAVLGISESSRADLVATLDRLGTNLLTIAPGQSFAGDNAKIPVAALAKIAHLSTVRQAASAVSVSSATVRRTQYVDPNETNGIALVATGPRLLSTLGGTLRSGRFLDAATIRYPTIVLGAVTAQRLGISSAPGGTQVYVQGQWFTVIGILAPLALAPDVDRSALIGLPVARRLFGTKSNASTIYVRTDPDRVSQTGALLAATANPEHPEEVQVSRPSDALAAKAAAKSAFTTLFLGLGAVALLVGGVGIANVMVISVLERRSEIGLRRALGATRRHISAQFLAEALLLSGLGGLAGVALGAVVTLGYAASRGLPGVVPASAMGGGLAAALSIGAVAGLYPAVRAARLSPTEALRTA